MEIVFVVLDISKPNGTERAVINLANYLSSKLNYSVEIITCNFEGREVFFEIDKKINIKHIGMKTFPGQYVQKIIWHIDVYKTLNEYLKTKKCDKIISTGIYLSIILSYTKFCKKVIACEHAPYLHPNMFFRLLRRISYNRLRHLVVLGENDYLLYKKFLKNITVIPNSLSFYPDKISDLEKKVLLSIGRFSYEKGLDILIDVLYLVFKKHKDWKCVIIGDGEQEQTIKKKIIEYQIQKNIELKKQVKDIESEYLNSSLYILPSRYEAFGMVLVEAMSCGVPCVSFDCTMGPREIIKHDIDGVLVEPYQVESMASRICELIENKEQRKKMGLNARENIKRYHIDNIIKDWIKVLEK